MVVLYYDITNYKDSSTINTCDISSAIFELKPTFWGPLDNGGSPVDPEDHKGRPPPRPIRAPHIGITILKQKE